MNLKQCSLLEVAAVASKSLEEAGIKVAVVGGSAVTGYAPEVHTSHDIDFAAISGTTRRAFGRAIAPLGFEAHGRDFVHPDTEFSLDLVADTPFIDRRAITEFTMLSTRYGPVRVLRFEDAIADRIAALLHSSDSQSLAIAERAVEACASQTSWDVLLEALDSLDSSGAERAALIALAKDRLQAAYRRGRVR